MDSKPPNKKKRLDTFVGKSCMVPSPPKVFISVLNCSVSNVSLFYGLSETIFHVFNRRRVFLTESFNHFNTAFSASSFIGGLVYKKTEWSEWSEWSWLGSNQVSDVIFFGWRTDIAIYLTHRERLQNKDMCNVVTFWKQNSKTWPRLQFCFHSSAGHNNPACENSWIRFEWLFYWFYCK